MYVEKADTCPWCSKELTQIEYDLQKCNTCNTGMDFSNGVFPHILMVDAPLPTNLHKVDHRPASPDDLRAKGLSVAVHNDYRLNGQAHTFWLMVAPDGMSFKGEGKTDAEALNQIREKFGTYKAKA